MKIRLLLAVGAVPALVASPSLADNAAQTDRSSAAGSDVVVGRAGNLTYVRSSVDLDGAAAGTASAADYVKCPAGSRAVAGGTTIARGADRAIASTTSDAAQRWYTEAWQLSASDSKVRAYVVCSSAAGITSYRHLASTDSTSIQGDESCDSGHVIGGGALAIGNAASYGLNTSYPVDLADADVIPDDGWRVYLDYTGSSGDGSVLVDAFCKTGAPPLYRVSKADVLPGKAILVRASCPKGTRVVGGGAYLSGQTAQGHVFSTRPYDSGDPGKVPEDGWEAGLMNTTTSSLQARSHAVCI